ncbi:UNVERIFIED_CONTAM: outer membrane biosynthesis protein TonB [Jeotgalibacillus campisalis]
MRHPVVPAVVLAGGLLFAPAAAAHAAPCDGKILCVPSEAPTEPEPTQPGLAPETDKIPSSKPEPTRVREPEVAPAPAPPVQAPPIQTPVQAPQPVQIPQQPEVTQFVTVAPQATGAGSNSSEPTATSGTTPAPATPSSSPSSGSASASPGKSSNWNTPVDKGKETEAAALASSSFSGPNVIGLFGILGAVLVVGLGGLAFALWSKNRLSSH